MKTKYFKKAQKKKTTKKKDNLLKPLRDKLII